MSQTVIDLTANGKDDKWTGRVYRDNDPRSVGRRFTVQTEPDKDGRVGVLDNSRHKSKISTHRLFSNKYTRLPELEK